MNMEDLKRTRPRLVSNEPVYDLWVTLGPVSISDMVVSLGRVDCVEKALADLVPEKRPQCCATLRSSPADWAEP